MGKFYLEAEPYLDQCDPGVYMEIGSSRNGDDGSTRIIAGWAQARHTVLHTVDMDPDQCELVLSQNLQNVTVHQQTGESFLHDWSGGAIGFLYLDNFDWDWHPENTEDFVLEQQLRYSVLGLHMHNVNCQKAHLQQAMLAMPFMAPRSVIACDDTWRDPCWDVFMGKSGAAVPYLLSQGYEVQHSHGHPVYGTILTRGITF